jgi:alkylhydroperoxidase family enzyme
MVWFTEEKHWQSANAVLPDIVEKFATLTESFESLPILPPSTLALCRVRVAQLHGVCLPRGELSDDRVENLSHWDCDPAFTPAERACLAYTEVYVIDHNAISDELSDAVKSFYGDAGLVALVQALGLFYGMTRVAKMWDITAAPEMVNE